MKSLLVGLVLCIFTSMVTAYLESFGVSLSQDTRSNSRHQIRSSQTLEPQLLPRTSQPENHRPTTKMSSAASLTGSGNLLSSQGLHPHKPTLERSSSKRKESVPLTGNPSQRPRVAKSLSTSDSTAVKPARDPLGKPPIHPSFKKTPAYAIKMEKVAASKAQREEFLRHWHNVLPDVSFLSRPQQLSKSLPEIRRVDSTTYRPPPFRPQAIPPSTGTFIPVH